MVIEDRFIDTKKIFLLNLHFFIRYIFGWQIFPILAIYSIAFIFLPISPLIFGFLSIIIMMMVYKLAFDVFADMAQGDMSPNVRQNYLVTNEVAVKVLIIALLLKLALFVINQLGYNEDFRLYFIICSTFITPAIYMILALTNSLSVALNPYNIFKVIKITFISYVLFVIFWVVTIQLHEVVINPFAFESLPVFLSGIFSSFIEFAFLILNFQIMGYIVFQNRKEFDLEGMGLKKYKYDDIETDVEIATENPIYSRIKMLLAGDEVQQALSIVVELQKEGDSSGELQELYKKAMQLRLQSPTNDDVARQVHLDIKNNKVSTAFKKIVAYLDDGHSFTEEVPEDVKPLILYLMPLNKVKYIDILLHGFHDKYPNHVDVVPNYFLLAKALYNDKASRIRSRELLIFLIEKYPNDQSINEVKAWLKGLELLLKKS